MPKARTVRLAPGIAHRVVEGRTLVLGPGDHALMALNGSGAFLWSRLSRATTVEVLARALARKYGLEEARARQDVDAFVRHLAKRRLIVER